MPIWNAVEEYSSRRSQFIEEDRSLRLDRAKLQCLTPVEAHAERIVRALRAEEAKTLWGRVHEDIQNPYPGMEFLTGRKIIDQSRLFQLLTKMPKGALLHIHQNAAVDSVALWEFALTQPLLHVCADQVLTARNLLTVRLRFLPISLENGAEHANSPPLTDADYIPNSWVPLHRARNSFPTSLGGPQGFDKFVISHMVIDPAESYGTHNTSAKIWLKFMDIFGTTKGLIFYTPIWRWYLLNFFRSSVEDGISYLEVRITLTLQAIVDEYGNRTVTHRDVMIIFNEVLESFKVELASQGRQDEFIDAKIIYTAVRSLTPEALEWYTEDCLALKKEFPNLIVGFDLVGDENALNPLKYYLEPLFRFRERQQELGLDIPFIFHAGETLGDGTEADENLYDAILLGTRRIGHGFSIVKHPRIMEICRTRGIALEMCPISNEILRLTSSMPMHPLPIVLNNGVPVVLSSDDPSIFGNMGLSYDYYQVLVASEVNGLITLGEMARSSLQHSMLDDIAKARALELYEKRWSAFVEWVVSEYSSQVDT